MPYQCLSVINTLLKTIFILMSVFLFVITSTKKKENKRTPKITKKTNEYKSKIKYLMIFVPNIRM